MSKTEDKMTELAEEVSSVLAEPDAVISMEKRENSLDMEIKVKATAFQAAFMASAIGHTNRKIAVGMLTGLLCAIFKGHEDKPDAMTDILTGVVPVLSDEEIAIMEESALAAFIMRKHLEESTKTELEGNKPSKSGKISDCFGNIKTRTLQ